MGKVAPPSPPGAVRWITRTLEEAGFETWAVGGAVRDALLGRPVSDWDLTTAAPPGRVRSLFPRTIPLGIEHGTVGVLARDGAVYEVTTFRKDVATDGRHATVEFARTVEEDLSRRDFTMNAVAWHPLRGEFRDPFHGGRDLQAGLLRTVGRPEERFGEDYLRVLRALRFAARFRLTITPDTWQALAGVGDALHRLSPERIREELMKVMALDVPSSGLALYAASGVLATLFPAVQALRGTRRPEGGDAWVRSVLVADALSPRDPLLRLAALLQELGLPEDAQAEGSTEPIRRRGVQRSLALTEALRFSNAQVARVAGLVDAAAHPPPDGALPPVVRRWLSRVGREPIPHLARLWMAGARVDRRLMDRSPSAVVDRIRDIRREMGRGVSLAVDELVLDGRDLILLGYRPGKEFGRVLQHLLDRVLEDPERNRREWLEAEAAAWMARHAQRRPTTQDG
jgi:tRNA nucleotidyltransferase (CCA-adding enzyme)